MLLKRNHEEKCDVRLVLEYYFFEWSQHEESTSSLVDLFKFILILASSNNVTLVCGYCGMIRCMLDMDTHCMHTRSLHTS